MRCGFANGRFGCICNPACCCGTVPILNVWYMCSVYRRGQVHPCTYTLPSPCLVALLFSHCYCSATAATRSICNTRLLKCLKIRVPQKCCVVRPCCALRYASDMTGDTTLFIAWLTTSAGQHDAGMQEGYVKFALCALFRPLPYTQVCVRLNGHIAHA